MVVGVNANKVIVGRLIDQSVVVLIIKRVLSNPMALALWHRRRRCYIPQFTVRTTDELLSCK